MKTAFLRDLAMAGVAAAGMALSLYTLQSTPERLRAIERKTADLASLQDAQRQSGAEDEALAALEQLPSTQPPPLADLARQAQITVPPDVRLRDSQAVMAGWSARSAEISWSAVRFTELGRFIQAAEAARPPWRLRECTLAPSERGEDRTRASLVMESLEKKRP